MSKITKAIIPVAGWGTRRLPITKTIEKCMLPVGNRPLVDYVVEDCLKAGITEIIFIVSENSSQLQDYYSDNNKLNDYLTKNNKISSLPLITPPSDVQIRFVTQPSKGKYGTAIPVALASNCIEPGESAVVLMGDDLIYNSDGSSEVARLIASVPEGSCGLLAAQVNPEEVTRYGVIEQDDQNNYVRIVDQPSVEEAPTNLINISKYLLTKEVIDAAAGEDAFNHGEYQITQVINNFVAKGGNVKVIPAVGQYLDGGTVEGWLHANNVVIGQKNSDI